MNLAEAIKTGRLSDFISEQESHRVEKIDIKQFDVMVKNAVKAPPPQDQTSGSRAHDDSNGK